MSRTVLFERIRRSMQVAQYALKTDAPPDELTDIARETRALDRRRFVGVSAGALVGLGLQGCAPGLRPGANGGGGTEPVLIVGAGIAGLTAAYRLRQKHVAVRIMEAQNRVGGRMFSLRGFFPDAQVVELGGELIDTDHTHVQALAAELGVVLDDLSKEDPSIATDVWYFGGQTRSDAEVVAAFRPIAERITSDLATLKNDGDVTHEDPANGERLDNMSVAQWLDGAGVTGWIRDLLRVGYVTEFGLELEEQSALNLLTLIDPEPDPFRIFGASDERYHAHEGNDSIPLALAKALEDAIELSTELEAITRTPDGAYTCSFRRNSGSFSVTARHVVIAIPFSLLRRVRLDVALPPVKQRAINELGYGTNAKLMVGFSERLWRTKYNSNGSVLTDLPFQLTWETSRKQAGSHGVLTNFTGGRHGVELNNGTPAEQATLFVQDLDRVFPGVGALRAGMKEVRMHWPTFPWTRGSYACYKPGQWTAFRGEEGKRVENLHFCGEHTSLPAQGYMEGGCETGESVAQEILTDLGIRTGMSPVHSELLARLSLRSAHRQAFQLGATSRAKSSSDRGAWPMSWV